LTGFLALGTLGGFGILGSLIDLSFGTLSLILTSELGFGDIIFGTGVGMTVILG
jgi:hypothetical protein